MRNIVRLGVFTLCLGTVWAQEPLSASRSLAFLSAGNRRFVADKSTAKPLGEGVRRTLTRGQSPLAIIVTCSDSRVVPEHIFNAGLGELFVIRNAGGVNDPETLASIEYAVEHLGTPLCVVMSHTDCSAIARAAGDQPHSRSLTSQFERLQPAIRRARDEGLRGHDLLRKAERENAYETIAEALRRSPAVHKLVSSGKLEMRGAHYQLATGQVEWLPAREIAMSPTTDATPARITRGLPPHTALTLLHAGHRRFLAQPHSTGIISMQRRTSLLEGQHPIAIVVTCADSRVPPEHIFDTGLGELFVVRVAGNVLTDSSAASIEHAILETGASLCIVLGHQSCGAVTAAIEHLGDPKLSPSMQSLLGKIEPAVERARRLVGPGAELKSAAIDENTRGFLGKLRARSKLVQRLESEGRFTMLPAVYMLDSGDIRWLKESSPIASAPPPAAPHGETHHDPDHGAGEHATPAPDGHAAAVHDHPAQHHETSSPAKPEHGSHAKSHGEPAHDNHAQTHQAPLHETHKPAEADHGDHAQGHDESGSHAEEHATPDHGSYQPSPGYESLATEHYEAATHSHSTEAPRFADGANLLMTLGTAALVTIAGLLGLLYWQRRSFTPS